MSDETPTVKIKSCDDYTVINESDYDEKVHKLFDGKPKGEAIQPHPVVSRAKAKSK